MYNIIKDEFKNTLGSVKHQDIHSSFFSLDKGERQGDGIRPTMLNIFINDIGKIFDQDRSDPLELLESKIGILLFADDMIILSKSKEGLQKSLDNLSEYCDKWQLTVNVKKSKAMIFQNNCKKLHDPSVKFKGSYLENVK